MDTLERIKIIYGKNRLIKEFEKDIITNISKAVKNINSNTLSFFVVYDLIPMISQYNLFENLSLRNRYAIRVYKDFNSLGQQQEAVDDIKMLKTLKWIVNSSVKYDGIDDRFDAFIDYSIGRLYAEYKDFTISKIAVDLMFERARKNKFNHDLVWIILGSCDGQVIAYLINRLNSTNNSDRMFAAELLGDVAGDELENGHTATEYKKWWDENKDYLESQKDGFNMCTNPKFVKTNFRNKYMCRNTKSKHISYNECDDMTEYNNILVFEMLNKNQQKALAHKSKKLHDNDYDAWREFKSKDLYKQILDGNDILEV